MDSLTLLYDCKTKVLQRFFIAKNNKQKHRFLHVPREYTEKFSNPYRAAEQGFIDEVIQPRDTRFKLIQALEMAKNKSQSNPPKKHGNIPL